MGCVMGHLPHVLFPVVLFYWLINRVCTRFTSIKENHNAVKFLKTVFAHTSRFSGTIILGLQLGDIGDFSLGRALRLFFFHGWLRHRGVWLTTH